jgi:hypothetical protein
VGKNIKVCHQIHIWSSFNICSFDFVFIYYWSCSRSKQIDALSRWFTAKKKFRKRHLMRRLSGRSGPQMCFLVEQTLPTFVSRRLHCLVAGLSWTLVVSSLPTDVHQQPKSFW